MAKELRKRTTSFESYFVETPFWKKILRGDIDIIYGPKGSGKSAVYFLLLKKRAELRNRKIALIAGENPRGTTAFRDLATDPPASETEFIGIWKLYIAALVGKSLQEMKASGESFRRLKSLLTEAGLLTPATLEATLRAVRKFIRSWINIGIEAEIKIDPITGMPLGVEGRIAPGSDEPTQSSVPISLDALVSLANDALAQADITAWMLLDRLDIAFADSRELEENALRALFKVYLDLRRVDNLELKIFLRDDIWRRITSVGFREASHITRHLTIEWDARSLLHLIVKRAIQNSSIQKFYSSGPDEVLLSHESQKAFFYNLFPEQVEKGERRPTTFDWILSRTRDGTKSTAPRELIHLLNNSTQKQLNVLEIGGYEPEGKNLVAGAAFKEALPEVSQVRLTQTLYAEYPSLKLTIEKLRGEKTSQTISTLAVILGVTSPEAHATANELVSVGFFEERGDKQSPEFWVPFLYRDALNMIQGSAE